MGTLDSKGGDAMKPELRRILFSLAVLLWAGCLLYFYGSGRIVKYLAPDFRVIALAGGLGLAVMGLFNLLTAFQKADCGHDHGDGEEHDHEGGDMNPWTSLLLMVLPVALSTAWTKDGFSQSTLARKGLYDDVEASSSAFLASALPPLTLEEIEKGDLKFVPLSIKSLSEYKIGLIISASSGIDPVKRLFIASVERVFQSLSFEV